MLLPSGITGLPRDSVANVSQIVTPDKGLLVERVKKLPAARLDTILNGIAIVFGKQRCQLRQIRPAPAQPTCSASSWGA